MPIPLSQWLEERKAQFRDISDREVSEVWLHRDPIRPIFHDPSLLLSPADGIVLYCGIYAEGDNIEAKGRSLSLGELLEGHWLPTVPCLVVGIFMTFWCVHITRAPVAGPLFYRELPALKTQNLPLVFAENELLKDKLGRALSSRAGYEMYNARTINRFVAANRDVLVVQIADQEVNVIAPFTTRQGWFYRQGERFGMVRQGSQVCLIVPGISIDEIGVVPLIKAGVHIEGSEPIARFTS